MSIKRPAVRPGEGPTLAAEGEDRDPAVEHTLPVGVLPVPPATDSASAHQSPCGQQRRDDLADVRGTHTIFTSPS